MLSCFLVVAVCRTQFAVSAPDYPRLTAMEVEDWGSVVVNYRCSGCMTCRVVAPDIFEEVPERSSGLGAPFSRAIRDPKNREEYHSVRQAIFLCPGKAIHVVRPPRVPDARSQKLFKGFPRLLEDGVYYVGYDSAATFGAASYFIQREDGENMFIDPPAFDQELLHALQSLGGIKYLLFTHRDHTANHEAWFNATQAIRLMHEKDVHWKKDFSPFPVTAGFERKLSLAPFESETLEGCRELVIVCLPGHTPGSLFFIYRNKFVFTGDSLAYSPAKGHLHAHRIQCWQDWRLQRRSLEHLSRIASFTWVLPGHGDQHRFQSEAEAKASLQKCLSWMDEQGAGYTNLLWYILFRTLRERSNNSRFMLWIADNLVLPSAAKHVLPCSVMPSWQLCGLFLLPWLAIPFAGMIRSRLRLSTTCSA